MTEVEKLQCLGVEEILDYLVAAGDSCKFTCGLSCGVTGA